MTMIYVFVAGAWFSFLWLGWIVARLRGEVTAAHAFLHAGMMAMRVPESSRGEPKETPKGFTLQVTEAGALHIECGGKTLTVPLEGSARLAKTILQNQKTPPTAPVAPNRSN